MTIAETIKQTVETLPPEKQQAVLNFAKSLDQGKPQGRRRSLRGVLKGVHVSAEDIAQMRREAWAPHVREEH